MLVVVISTDHATGGAFTTDVTWRWVSRGPRYFNRMPTKANLLQCFYINLPIGAIVVVPVWFLLKPGEPKQKGLTIRQQLGKLDLLGNLFLFPCVICLLLALQWGGSTYAWSNGRIIALFVMFGVLLSAFVVVQVSRPETATIPARIIRNRSIIGGMWYVICVASVMMIIVYVSLALKVCYAGLTSISIFLSGFKQSKASQLSSLESTRYHLFSRSYWAQYLRVNLRVGSDTTLHGSTVDL